MQASMGQTATTLNSLLEMNGEHADGDTEENVEATLLQARQELVEAVQKGLDSSVAVNKLLQLKIPVAMKYAQLNVRQILKDNNETVAHLKTIPTALGMLEKYGRHLLKPREQRVDQWRQIKFNNPIFKDRVLPMRGALDIVNQMGYSESVDSGLQFAYDEPDTAATCNLVADIILARAEMDRYLQGTHPHPDMIHSLLPESTTEQISAFWDQLSGSDMGTFGVSQVSSMALHQLQPPTPVTTAEVEKEASVAGQSTAATTASESGETVESLNSSVSQQDDMMGRVCDICGEQAATKWCSVCDNKQLCNKCDDMWHTHPKRTSHIRNPIASLPSPSGPGPNLMGPFGIRAAPSMRSISQMGRDSPVSSSGTSSSEIFRSGSAITPPPSQLTQPQSAVDALASLQQHHQQLHYYQQLQQHQWPQHQQQSPQQQQQQHAAFNAYPPRVSQQELEMMYPSAPLRENMYPQYMASGLGYAAYPTQPPYPQYSTHDPSHPGVAYPAGPGEVMPVLPPSINMQQRQGYMQGSQPDVSLRTQMQGMEQTSVPGVRSNASVSGYPDVSLRQSQMGARPEQNRHSGSAPVTESGLVLGKESMTSGIAPRRPSSMSSVSASSLLSSVLAESDYEKRAAKCDIRLLTLQEDIADVEQSLNDLMLSHEDFCERPEFRTLNRRKATLMREQQVLANYRLELAELMEAEALPDQPGQPVAASQVFHPPPLSSSPSQPQLGLSSRVSSAHPGPLPPSAHQIGPAYPQQMLHSPVQSSEYSVAPAAYQNPAHPSGIPSAAGQWQDNYGASSVQESAAGVQGGRGIYGRSSVDRSSILPQWQMVPSNVASSNSPALDQLVSQPLARYQESLYGNGPIVPMGQNGPSVPVSQNVPASQNVTNYPIPATMGSPPNQITNGPLEQTRRAHSGPAPNSTNSGSPSTSGHFVQSQSAVELSQGANLDLPRPGSAPSLPQAGAHPANPPQAARKPMQVLPPPPLPQAASPQLPSANGMKFGAPQQEWQCNHCTFINPPATRVCSMCDRTSDNPTLVSSLSETQRGQNVFASQLQSCPAPPVSPEQVNVTVSETVESKHGSDEGMNNADVVRKPSRIAEEQDRIFLEKKEAQKKYNLQMQQAGASQSPDLSAAVSELSISSPPLPPRPPPPRQRSPDGTSSSGGQQQKQGIEAKGTVSKSVGVNSDVSRLIQQESRQQDSLSSGGSGSGSGDHGDVGGGGCGGMGSMDSETSFIKEGDFSQTMERFSEQKKIKEMQLNGADLMYFIKMADRKGHAIEEMQVALTQCKGNHKEALDWLQTQWGKLVEVVMSSAKAKGERGEQNDVGEISQAEARTALRESCGELQTAINKCVSKRRELYAKLNPDGKFAREEVLQAMLQSEGKEIPAREQLHTAMLQPFLNRVWEGMDGERQGTETLQILQVAMAESCQSVSNSVISHVDFQQVVMNKEIDRDRRIRMVLVEGKLKSWGRAELVIKLLDDHLPNAYAYDDSHYSLEDVVEAVRNCRDRHSALAYLTQECSICLAPYPMGKIRNLNFCQCKICSDCLKQNFEVVIRERHVRHWTCPICGYPDLNDAETAAEYLTFLGMLLQSQVAREVYDLFDTKVRDWYLQKDPNFRWCAHCGNGFIADAGQLRMQCPHCGDKTCYKCKKQWEDQHEGLTCDEFAQWKIDNDPNNQAVGLARHLEENGIDCPSCKMRYALAKGGCMHFKCPQCGHEFCSGCYEPFYQRGMCTRLKSCRTNGLHAHHPRDCFFYLRDDDIDHLQSMLRAGNIEFNTVPPASQEDTSLCPVIEQKEFDLGKKDESCGKATQEGHAGLCALHYKEYLVGLINKNHVDPVDMMTVDDIKKLLKRGELNIPKKSQNEADANYRKRMIKFVKEKLPLPTRIP